MKKNVWKVSRKLIWIMPIVLIVSIVLITVFFNFSLSNNSCIIKDSSCGWKPGFCEAMVMPGYYYDCQTRECKYYQGSGCSNPPFLTIKECTDICRWSI